jgi:hypothetical protein
MGKEQYSAYGPAYLTHARYIRKAMRADKKAAKKFFGKELKKVKPEVIEKLAFQQMMKDVAKKQALYQGPCVDKQGRHVYYPVPGMLEELYHAHFDVENEPLVFPHKSFTVAVPRKDSIGGMRIPGFMVNVFTKEEKVEFGRQFGNDLYGEPMGVDVDKSADEGRSMFITSRERWGLSRASTPIVRVQSLLDAADDRPEAEVINEILGVYDAPGMYRLSDEENAMYFRMIKSVVALCVYMQSDKCVVVDGYPEDMAGESGLRKPRPHTIGGQDFKYVRHGSPRAHYRRWHFRRYPKKKDGTRKTGLVAVKGSFVGPRETPHTVKEKEDAKK